MSGSGASPDPAPGPRLEALAGLFAGLSVIATLANGSGFLLRRLGLLDAAAYRTDLLQFCRQPIQQLWLPASCHFRRLLSLAPLQVQRLDPARLYVSGSGEVVLKALKYGVMAGLILTSTALILARVVPPPRWRALAPALPLLVGVASSLAISARAHGLPIALAALASVSWLPLLVVGQWLCRNGPLQRLADAMAVLLLLQVPLTLLEAMRGLPLPFGPWRTSIEPPALPLPSRLSGAFILPNSLGVFAVCALAFCLGFSHRRRWRPWLIAAAVLQVLLARSAAGCLGLLGLALLPLLERQRASGRLVALAGLAALLAAALPRLLGRPDLLESLGGRSGQLAGLLDPDQPLRSLFGQGLAAAGNRLYSLLDQLAPLQHRLGGLWPDPLPLPGPGDSQLVLLLVQGGLLLAAAFYGLLILGLRRDRAARPFLLTLLLCSLTLNVSELFPLELLLPVALAHSLMAPPLSPSAAWPPAPAAPRPSRAAPASSRAG